MKSFSQILKESPDVETILLHQEKYWAHTHQEKGPELLYQHTKLVSRYSEELVQSHNLDSVIDNLVNTYVDSWEGNIIDKDLIKQLFVHSIVFHDFGKVNDNFQRKRMNNKQFNSKNYENLNPSYGHSYLGAFIFICYHISKILKMGLSQENELKLISNCFFFAYPIMQHHNSRLYDVIEREGLFSSFKMVLDELKPFLDIYSIKFDERIVANIIENIEDIWFKSIYKKMNLETSSFSLFSILKLSYSLMTASDYLATHEYMNGGKDNDSKTIDFGVLNDCSRIEEIYRHITQFKYNVDIYKNLETHEFNFPNERSNKNLNFLRKQMGIEIVNQIKSNLNKRLFYLEAPTGGGKTNFSVLVIGELLMGNPELNKVFYVFPYTTLITQTYAVVKESLNLKDNEIVELHSKAALKTDTEKTKDGLYGNEKRDFIDNQFALYPITLMSHVKFFDILKTNDKSSNYLLHRLANSIVIIDEIQSYNPNIWDKMLYFIENYAKLFNIRFILMSATLPKISNLDIGLVQKTEFIDLAPNATKYLTNINFSGRVEFNLDLLKEDCLDINYLKDIVKSKSKEYINKNGSVKTIIEFIYKRSAAAFKNLFINDDLFDHIFILSGTILESRRKEIINFIKLNKNNNINILLITTQVVEAGVDIDMDLGFKNASLLDSDEQLAGRVNRNANKDISTVYLFEIDDPNILYSSDIRYQETKKIPIEERENILKNKDFKILYEKVILKIDRINEIKFADNMSAFKEEIQLLQYIQIDKAFKIIDQPNNSIFVPLDIPIEIDSSITNIKEAIFTEKELDFLSCFNVYPIYNSNCDCLVIQGQRVWGIYENLIKNSESKIKFDLQKKINFRNLQTIMSKFCFSLISHSKDYRELTIGFGYEVYGYFYLNNFAEEREFGCAYDYNNGLNSDAFSDSNFI